MESLFEIAGGYDDGPLFQLQQMRFSDRMVAMMDGTSAWWAFRWLLSGDTPGSTSRLVLGGDILVHLGLHLGHVGFLWNSTRINHAGNYDPAILRAHTLERFGVESVGRRLFEVYEKAVYDFQTRGARTSIDLCQPVQ